VFTVDRDKETLQQRRERYLARAAEAEDFATVISDPQARTRCLELAKSWRTMAADIIETGSN
jgi:hypothetical protein